MDGGGTVDCPYCGEPTWVPVDPDGGSRQRYVSDCEVCCRPIHVTAQVAPDGTAVIRASTEDDPG